MDILEKVTGSNPVNFTIQIKPCTGFGSKSTICSFNNSKFFRKKNKFIRAQSICDDKDFWLKLRRAYGGCLGTSRR
jgi:hypothetical protein